MACTDPECIRRAQMLRDMADAVLLPVAGLTRLPPPVVQGFVEGSAVGAVKAAQAKGKKRKASAYAKSYGRAYKRLAKKYAKKNGDLRKGWDHQRLVKAAHKIARSGK